MAGKQNPKKPKKGKKKAVDWDAVREDFLVQNLDPARETPYTFAACAKTWGVTRPYLSKKATEQDWRAELRVRAKAQADASVERRQETYAEVEREIRERHGAFCRGLVAKSAIKFNSLDKPEDMTIDQMLKMLAFAMPEEREARGIPKYHHVTNVVAGDPEREMETPGMRIERRRSEREVKKELLELLAGVDDVGE